MSAIIQYDHPQARSVENELTLLVPRFADLLGSHEQALRITRSVMIAMDRNRKLFECDPQSRLTAAMSAASVNLECDGVLGQSFLVPFKDKRRGLVAQFMTGYRGYNTLAARGGFAIRSDVVRENDPFSYDKAAGTVRHLTSGRNRGDIVGAWARAVHATLPAIVEFVPIDELLELRARAKSTSGEGGAFSPWLDAKVGFPAMCEKTPKRRLARSLPLGQLPQFAIAARIDEAVDEQGLPAWADPRSGVQVGSAGRAEPAEREQEGRAPIIVTTERKYPELPPDLEAKAVKLGACLEACETVAALDAQWNKVPKIKEQIRVVSSAVYDALVDLYDKRRSTLQLIEEGAE